MQAKAKHQGRVRWEDGLQRGCDKEWNISTNLMLDVQRDNVRRRPPRGSSLPLPLPLPLSVA